MPIIDILIAVAISASVVVGVIRGFVKESLSIAALLLAIWAALYFGPSIADISNSWLNSEGARVWFGRILVFAVVLSLGGLLSWGVGKIVRMSVIKNIDRFFGSVFGAVRGILLVSLAVMGGQFAGFDGDNWWLRSRLIPRLEVVVDWIKIMAPQGFELLTPDEDAESFPIDIKFDFPNFDSA